MLKGIREAARTAGYDYKSWTGGRFDSSKFEIVPVGQMSAKGDEAYVYGAWEKRARVDIIRKDDAPVRRRLEKKPKLVSLLDEAESRGYCFNENDTYKVKIKNYVLDTNKWTLIGVGEQQNRTDLCLSNISEEGWCVGYSCNCCTISSGGLLERRKR